MMNQKPFRGEQINKTHPLARGLVGAWIFNELTGEKVFDLSNNGNNGTIDGAVWVPDGLSFDGSSNVDCGEIGHNNNITVCALVNPYGSTDSNGYIVRTTYSAWEFDLKWQSNSYIYFLINGQANTNTVHSLDDDWFNIVGTYNKTSYDLWLDGRKVDSAPYTADINSAIQPVLIGSSFGGKISYVYIYSRALSPSEIAWLHAFPYCFFERPINPAIMYYESVGGIISPTGNIYGSLYGPLAGVL